jgi:hypothetical protein
VWIETALCNEATGKCVKKTGAIGKQIAQGIHPKPAASGSKKTAASKKKTAATATSKKAPAAKKAGTRASKRIAAKK